MNATQPLRLLITAGATREPIDDVRFVSNVSSGGTGAALAAALAARGHRVTLLRGQGSVAPANLPTLDNAFFGSAEDLRERLAASLAAETFDAVIMCAAVADYRPVSLVEGKIRSDADSLTIRLVRNPKILPSIKAMASPSPLVIGFKLTSRAEASAQQAAVDAQFEAGGVDAVVHNDLAEIRRCAVHPFHLYRTRGDCTRLYGTGNLALSLAALIETRRKRLQ